MTPAPPILTSTDVAELLGVTTQTVYVYRSRGTLPEPDGRLGATPYWKRSTIRSWLKARPGQGFRSDLLGEEP